MNAEPAGIGFGAHGTESGVGGGPPGTDASVTTHTPFLFPLPAPYPFSAFLQASVFSVAPMAHGSNSAI